MNPERSKELLGGTENLLREGLRRLEASAELPGAHQPLREALELTERQTLATITAAEQGQSVLAELRRGQISPDTACDQLEAVFQQIVASQQVGKTGEDPASMRQEDVDAILRDLGI